jgi:hypothetical protein
MQRTAIVTTAALSVAHVAVLSLAAINAKSSTRATTVPASTSIDVMQMMKDSRDLPEQRYDAH